MKYDLKGHWKGHKIKEKTMLWLSKKKSGFNTTYGLLSPEVSP